MRFNPLNAELNPICHLLALLEAHHILHVSRIRVNNTNRTGSSGTKENSRNSSRLHMMYNILAAEDVLTKNLNTWLFWK